MHFHSRCNVNFICGSIMSLHIKFRCGLRSPDKQQIDIFVVFFELLMHSLKSKQTMFSQTDPMETVDRHTRCRRQQTDEVIHLHRYR